MSELNVMRAAWGVVRALRVNTPAPAGDGELSHQGLAPTLEALAGPGGLAEVDLAALDAYLAGLHLVDPDTLARPHSLAFWINLYNAAAVRLAVEATRTGASTVLRVPGAFDRVVATVAGERLSLNDLEHGKIRRFGDPRIHAALVCGSLSCPSLRPAPFEGGDLARALDDRMRAFLASGGWVSDHDAGTVSLSRVFRWYGGDLLHPMPSFRPVRGRAVLRALLPWAPVSERQWVEAAGPSVRFQAYDWGLGCSVAGAG